MLVLTRKEGESIMVGDNVKIEVVDIRGSSVRIGISAPKDMAILRSELVAEQPEQRSSQDDGRMDCEGHDAPFSYDCDPPLVVGRHAL